MFHLLHHAHLLGDQWSHIKTLGDQWSGDQWSHIVRIAGEQWTKVAK